MIRAIHNKGVLDVVSSDMNLIDGQELLLTEIKETRTLQQNRYLWKVFQIIGDELGYDKDDMKELLLRELKHTRVTINKKTGEEITSVAYTHNLNKVEFSDLTERIIRWSAEHGINILSPQEFFETC